MSLRKTQELLLNITAFPQGDAGPSACYERWKGFWCAVFFYSETEVCFAVQLTLTGHKCANILFLIGQQIREITKHLGFLV